jgi:hypothetical protein
MKHDELDRILSNEEEISPSSGFTASVMKAVRREASAPPAIPFPWLRALPGIIVAGVTLVVIAVEVVIRLARTVSAPQAPVELPSWLAPSVWVSILKTPLCVAAIWVTLALLVSLASLMVSMRLTSTRA